MTTRRQFLEGIPAAGAAFAIGSNFILESSSARAEPVLSAAGHFHPMGKEPSKFTKEILAKAKDVLPFNDSRDFDELPGALSPRCRT